MEARVKDGEFLLEGPGEAVLPQSSVKDHGATLKNTSDAHAFLPSAHAHRTPTPRPRAQRMTRPSALPDEAFLRR